jgi:uncharacterized protein
MITSPCIKECRLNDVEVCMGCHRTLTEIMDWPHMTDRERRTVYINIITRESQELGLYNSSLDKIE